MKQNPVRFLMEDSLERRQAGLSIVLLTIFAVAVLYLFFVLRFIPDMGVRLLIAAVAGTMLVLSGPKVTFPLYFATWFTYGIPLPGLPITLNQLLGAAFLGSWVVSWINRGIRVPMSPGFLLLGFYTIYAVMVGIIHLADGAPISYQQALYFLTAVAVFSVYRGRDELLKLLGIMVAISCAILSVGLFEFILRRDIAPQFSDHTMHANNIRINGIARNAIQYGYQCTFVLPWALLIFLESRSPRAKKWALAALMFCATLAVMTFNRQTPIIIAAMFAGGLLWMRYKHRVRLAVGLAAAGVLVAPYFLWKIIQRVIDLGGTGRPDMSFMIRHDKYLTTLEMMRDYPLFGIGLNNFKDMWWDYRPVGDTYVIHFEKNYQHFIDLGYLQIITETGIVGVGLFLLVIACALVAWISGWKRACQLPGSFERNFLAVVGMGFIQLMISMLVQDTFFVPQTYLLFALLYVALAMVKRAESRAAEPPVTARA